MVPETPLIIRHLGTQQYNHTFNAMKKFNEERNEATADEIWFVEHYPVFTQGQAGKEEYILVPDDIPVVKSDRGGHVTYHGPGQITAYLLIDLRRLNIGVRQLVSLIDFTRRLYDACTIYDYFVINCHHIHRLSCYCTN